MLNAVQGWCYSKVLNLALITWFLLAGPYCRWCCVLTERTATSVENTRSAILYLILRTSQWCSVLTAQDGRQSVTKTQDNYSAGYHKPMWCWVLTRWTSERHWSPALKSCRPRGHGRRCPSWPRSIRKPPQPLSAPPAGCRQIWRGRQVLLCTSGSIPAGGNREKQASTSISPTRRSWVINVKKWWSQVAVVLFISRSRYRRAVPSVSTVHHLIKTRLLAGSGKQSEAGSAGNINGRSWFTMMKYGGIKLRLFCDRGIGEQVRHKSTNSLLGHVLPTTLETLRWQCRYK